MANIHDILDGNFSDDENNQNETPTNFAHTITEIHYISELKKILVGRNNNTIYQKFKIDNRIQDLYDFQVVNKNNQIVDLSGFNYQFYGSYIDARQNEHILFYSDTFTVSEDNILTFKVNTYTSEYVNYVKTPKQIDIAIRKRAEGINQVILRDIGLAYPTPVYEGEEPSPCVAGFGLSKNGYVMSLTGTILSGDGSTIAINDNVISYIGPSGTTYTAGTGIGISDQNVISLTATIPLSTSQLVNDSDYISQVVSPDSSINIHYLNQNVLQLKVASGFINNYALKTQIPTGNAQLENTANYITINALSDYATTGWVEEQGYLTAHQDLSNYAQLSDIPLSTSQLWNDNNYINSLISENNSVSVVSNMRLNNGGMQWKVDVNSSWLNGKYAQLSAIPTSASQLTNDVGYLTAVPSDIATTGWVESKGYLTGITIEGFYWGTWSQLTRPKVSFGAAFDYSQEQLRPNYAVFSQQLGLSDYAQTSAIPTGLSQLTNDSYFVTSSALTGFLSSISVYDSENQQMNEGSALEFDPTYFYSYVNGDNVVIAFNGISLYIEGEDQGSYTTIEFGPDFDFNSGEIGVNTANVVQDIIDNNMLSGYALTSQIPSAVSQLDNDEGFITSSALTGISTDKLQTVYVDNTIHDASFVMQYIPDVDIVQQSIYTDAETNTLTINKVSGFESEIPVGKVATFENWITPVGDLTGINFSRVQLIGELPEEFTSGYTQAFTRRIYRASEDYTIQQISYNYEFDARVPDTPLIFELVDDDYGYGGEIHLDMSGSALYNKFYYKINDGDWTLYTLGDSIDVYTVGDTISFKGTTSDFAADKSNLYRFGSYNNGKFKVKGKLNALINWSNINHDLQFNKLFHSCNNIVDASELILPSTNLTSACFRNLFYHASNLSAAPELKAVDIPGQAYSFMFNGTALVTAPNLSAAVYTSNESFANMFGGCTSLTGVPYIPATLNGNNCCQDMFNGCYSLKYIKVGFVSWPTGNELNNWVYGVGGDSSCIFECNSSLGDNDTISRGDWNCPYNWTVVNY